MTPFCRVHTRTCICLCLYDLGMLVSALSLCVPDPHRIHTSYFCTVLHVQLFKLRNNSSINWRERKLNTVKHLIVGGPSLWNWSVSCNHFLGCVLSLLFKNLLHSCGLKQRVKSSTCSLWLCSLGLLISKKYPLQTVGRQAKWLQQQMRHQHTPT